MKRTAMYVFAEGVIKSGACVAVNYLLICLCKVCFAHKLNATSGHFVTELDKAVKGNEQPSVKCRENEFDSAKRMLFEGFQNHGEAKCA